MNGEGVVTMIVHWIVAIAHQLITEHCRHRCAEGESQTPESTEREGPQCRGVEEC